MKKLLVSAIIALSLFACNSAEEKTKTSEPPEQKKNAALDNPDYDAGLNLIAKSDCFTCHKLRETLVGPPYGEIAKKYPNTPETIDTLVNRIIKGSQNVWGPTPMLAHPSVTKDEAEKMVKYILLLKE